MAAIAPTTSATLEARGIRVGLSAHGGVRELAQAVADSPAIPSGAEVFYPTSDAALRQPEHLAAVAILQRRFKVHTQAVYATVAPDNLAQELAALRSPEVTRAQLGYTFWSPSAIENFAAAQRLRTAARPGGADRRLDHALLAGNCAVRLAACLPARCRDATRMVVAFSGTRRRRRRRISWRRFYLIEPGLRIILRISARCISSAAIWSRAYSSSRMLLPATSSSSA